MLPDWLTLLYEEPIELVAGQGCRVTDGEGRTYLDFFGGILTTMDRSRRAGGDRRHSHPGRPAAAQLRNPLLVLVRPMIELAERISELSGIPDAKVFFVNFRQRGQ